MTQESGRITLDDEYTTFAVGDDYTTDEEDSSSIETADTVQTEPAVQEDGSTGCIQHAWKVFLTKLGTWFDGARGLTPCCGT